MSIELDVDEFFRSLDMTDDNVRKGAEKGMHDATDDLLRVASDIAPFAVGTLAKSGHKAVDWRRNTIIGEVMFGVTEGDFNYALWTHEEAYNHGEGTQNNPPERGMSGRTYYSGRKYLERPLKGESDAYKRHIAKTIRKELT